MAKKLTKREAFNQLIGLIASMDIDNGDEILDVLNHELELMDKKNSNRSESKSQKENKVLAEQLYGLLLDYGQPMCAKEIMRTDLFKDRDDCSSQKISALYTHYLKDRLKKSTIKDIVYYEAI